MRKTLSLVALASLALFAALLHGAQAAWYTFPAKSVNLNSTDVARPEFYEAFDGSLVDPHAVHGIQTTSGDYILVGKALETETATKTLAFAIKLDDRGSVVWTWKAAEAGSSAANAVAQVAADSIVVAGWADTAGAGTQGKAALWQIDISTGIKQWSSYYTTGTKTSAYEMVEKYSDYVLLSGFSDKTDLSEMSFKSYGNVPDGVALVMKVPLSKINGTVLPSLPSDVTWQKSFSGYITAKVARAVADSFHQVAVLLWAESEAKGAAVTMLRNDGTPASSAWVQPKDYGMQHGEATDLQVCSMKMSVIISGHGGKANGELSGRMSRILIQNGNLDWTKSFSVGGNPKLIFNECWGLAKVGRTGYVMSCGAGIENCNSVPASMKSDCMSGNGDTRAGAYKRLPGVWQSYMPRTNTKGELLYQRVDQYRAPGSPEMNASTWEPTSSASEWVINTNDGGFALVQDEQSGVGLLKLFSEDASSFGSNSMQDFMTNFTEAILNQNIPTVEPEGYGDEPKKSSASVASFHALLALLCVVTFQLLA